jgi:outer membrane protein assembly factor BamB
MHESPEMIFKTGWPHFQPFPKASEKRIGSWGRAKLIIAWKAGSGYPWPMIKPSKPRWKLLFVLLALPWTGVLLLFVLPALERYSSARTMTVMVAVLLTLVLTLLWLLAMSGLKWGQRVRGLLVLLVLGGAFAGLVRKDGHMGDFLPQLAWRWQPKPGEAVTAPLVVVEHPGEKITFTTDQPGDSPRFLGADGLNWQPADALAPDWTSAAPKELWRRSLGLGWSGFIVTGDLAITQEQRGEDELTVAYRLTTGEPVWQYAEKARFEESMGGIGPRATPTAHEGKVYALGATGILTCLDGPTGKLIWRRDTLAEAGHQNLMWATSSSPLIVGDKVIITLGKGPQTLAAYTAATGEPAWRSGPDNGGYSSPVLVTVDGKPQILSLFANSAGAYDPATGAELWSWTEGFKPAAANVANPIFLAPDRVLVALGYGVGATLLKTAPGTAPEILWQSPKMSPKFTNLVVRGTHAWGLDEGRLSCLDLTTGDQVWRGTKFGHGQILGAGPHLIIQSERGEVVIAEASPTEEKILTRFPALTSKTWNQPCLAGRHLLVRNDREAICFELKGK